MNQQQKRIDLIDKITKDDTPINVGNAAKIFLIALKGFFAETSGGKRIKKEIGEDNYNVLCTGLATTFLTSLFVSASTDKENLKERMDIVMDATHDILAAVKTNGVDA